jgi:hypothetical protein
VRELSTTRKLRGTRLSPALTATGLSAVLQQFDLVIECVVGYLDRGDSPPAEDRVTLEAETEWEPACSNGRAHEVVIAPRGHLQRGMPVRGPRTAASPEPLYLDWQPLDQFGGNNPLGALLGIFAMMIGNQVGLKSYEVYARSCGVRPGGATPNGELNAIFLFYRKMKIELSITLPAARELARVRGTGNVNVGGGPTPTTFESRSVATRYLPGTGTRSTELRTAETALAGRRDLGALAQSPDLARTRSPDVVEQPGATVLNDARVSIKVNGREADVTQWVQRILRMKERVEGVLDGFIELIQKAPQIGWRVEYTYQFLTGTIGADFERQEDTRPVDGRVLPAPRYLTLRAELTILKVEAALSFGFNFEGSWGSATARIRGSIGGDVKTSANLRIPGGNRKWTMAGNIPVELSATAELTVRRNRVASASLTVGSGFEVTGTIFDDEPPPPNTPNASTDPWKLEFKWKLKKGTLSARIEDAYTGFIRWTVTVDLWNERDLWSSRGNQ